MRFTAKNCQNLYVTFPDTYAVFLPGERSQGDVGALLAVLRSECDFGGNGDGAHNLEAPGDIGERIVQIATTGGRISTRTVYGTESTRARRPYRGRVESS